jgi:hypothetical protein
MRSTLLSMTASVVVVASVHAAEIGSTELSSAVPSPTAAAPSAVSSATSPAAAANQALRSGMWSASDAALAQLWGLTLPEIQRARMLMQGPRGAFSSPQLSPIEALGIHARTDAERDRYARLFARATYEDTQRVLAWSRVAQAELERLAAGQPVLSFDGVPKAAVSYEAADMLGVSRTAVVPPKRPGSSASAPAAAALPAGKAEGRATDNRSGRPAAGGGR